MLLPMTLTIAAACAVINIWLALRVSQRRIKGKVMIGDGGNAPLLAAVRAHANFVEYAPFVLILLAAIELAGGSTTWLWVAGAVFVVARVAHGLGMDRPAPNPLRAGGIGGTWTVMAALAVWALVLVYGNYHATTGAITTVPIDASRG
ncbi:MAPEG family protein [Sphingomonas sp. RHCKR47]|uniref:MAPEG family protein n=1 Tax=Sphingomonas citricola TaxID=2862498 RepID=UPI001CA5B1A0|nr:MAPEG family protein [Sphingomonas citricola]MBW6524322.1 MAPEG family protein [Sphingomonas citricola]